MAKAVLLDTCALLWVGGAPDRISAATRKRLESAVAVYASPVSLWEVAFKVALGKLELTMTPEEWFELVKADIDQVAKPYLRTTKRRAQAMESRLKANLGFPDRTDSIAYADEPMATDDPYRYFHW